MVNRTGTPTQSICLGCFWGDYYSAMCHCPIVAQVRKDKDGMTVGVPVSDDIFKLCLEERPTFSETEKWFYGEKGSLPPKDVEFELMLAAMAAFNLYILVRDGPGGQRHAI